MVTLYLFISLYILFTVAFNLISRVSLSATRYEYAYTTVWQLLSGFLSLLFIPFDTLSLNLNPHVLLLLVISASFWALVDAFLFSAYKHEEVSTLSAILPLSYAFTFVISVLFFQALVKPSIVVGFIIIMVASFWIGFYRTQLKPSKGVIFALLSSFFSGAALGLNSEIVKSFSIPLYMFVAYIFPALVNFFIFLRPKVSEVHYELKTQWKAIFLNAVVIDISYFFLLKAFQTGKVSQVVPLLATSTLLTALAGIVLLKEKKNRAIKVLAAALATLGVILVQL